MNTLTTKDIDHMKPGKELDALVAEQVMGWHRVDMTPQNNDWFWSDGTKHIAWDSFSPSLSISAAWEVVEKMCENGNYKFGLDNHDVPWAIGFSHSEGGSYFGDRAETVPLAICRAALSAVDWQRRTGR